MAATDNFLFGETVFLDPTPARGHVAHLVVEHRQGHRRVPDEKLQQLLALAQRSFRFLHFRNVLNGAAEFCWAPKAVELHLAHGAHPSHGLIRIAYDPMFHLELGTLVQGFPGETSFYRGAVLRMDQVHPSRRGKIVFGADSQDLSKDVGGRPRARREILGVDA